jgi:hypothetical protein
MSHWESRWRRVGLGAGADSRWRASPATVAWSIVIVLLLSPVGAAARY